MSRLGLKLYVGGLGVGLVFLSEFAAAQERVQAEEGFPWGTHLITVPLVLLFGLFIGWSLRERKYAQDQALREIEEDAAQARSSDGAS